MTSPRIAYILLWFPEPTQTFILDEVNTMAGLGLDLTVHTLYGPRPPQRLTGMAKVKTPVHHLGLASTRELLRSLARVKENWGPEAPTFLRQVILRRWRSFETGGEAWWAALAGVHLAGIFRDQGMNHIHAPWANGPATAAWVASQLSGIPFSFCGHAHDIYPPDGALVEKLHAASFVRTISHTNERYLADLAPAAAAKIVHITYGAPLTAAPREPRPPAPPYQLLALGRLVEKKGFPDASGRVPGSSGMGGGFPPHPGRGRPPAQSPGGPGAGICPERPGRHSWGTCPTTRSLIFSAGPTSSSCPVSWPRAATGTASPTSSWRPWPFRCR